MLPAGPSTQPNVILHRECEHLDLEALTAPVDTLYFGICDGQAALKLRN